MSLRKSVVAALAAVSMIAVPTVAYAAQAQSSVVAAPISKSNVRAGAVQKNASEARGGSTIIALLAAAAIIGGIIIAAKGSGKPASP